LAWGDYILLQKKKKKNFHPEIKKGG
jgi:hypothetical protein